MSPINSFLQLDSSQYAQVPIGATRVATKGNGTNLYGTIPTWTTTVGWEIEFDVVFPTTLQTSLPILIDSPSASNRWFFAINTNSKFLWTTTGVTSVTLDGVSITNDTTTQPTDGAVHRVKVVGSGVIAIGTLLRRYNAVNYSSSAIFNLRLTNLATPSNSRFYAMSGDGSSSVITDTSVNAQHGTWYNRTSGDVVTVYPDAIKPGEEFYFAIKYKVTDVSQNGGYNNPFSIGRRASGAYSCISLYLPESNGRFYVDPYNGTARTTGSGIIGKMMGATHLDGLTHVAVVRLKTDGSYEFWVDADTPKYTGVPNSQLAYAMDVINLNGYARVSDSAARMGINFHYVYLYSALSGADITALMQGANPETVGTIRQGYNLNGNGNEVNGGNALTLYGSPTFFHIRHLLGAIGSPIYDSVVVEHVDTTVK